MTNDYDDTKREISAEDRALAMHRFPVLAIDESRDFFGRDDPATDAMADQILTGIVNLAQWVEDYFSGLGRPALAVAVAGESFGLLRSKADRAFATYNRQFASPPGQPDAPPVGYTDESADHSTGITPDTRVYAIRASFPLERKPLISQTEFNAYAEYVRKQPSCDLQLNGPYCDQSLRNLHKRGKFDFLLSQPEYDGYPNVFAVPYVRGDVVIFLSMCGDCWYAYCQKHGIYDPSIIDPDDTID